MTRQTIRFFAALSLIGCGGDKAAPPKRSVIVPAPGVYNADVALDGRIAYSKFVNGVAAIYVSNADGSNAKRVSFGVWDIAPEWSPDGKWIVFNRASTSSDVVIVPADSGAERLVEGTILESVHSNWFPDGSAVLFTKDGKNGNELWEYHMADGSTARVLDVGNVSGYVSPDGKLVAYNLTKSGLSTIWTWDLEKKVSRQLTTEGVEFLGDKCFSPDGKSLLYLSSRTGTSDLWRLDLATGQLRQLTRDVANDGIPRWSPDGTRIMFLSQRGGQPDLWMLRNGEEYFQRITYYELPEVVALWASDGRSIVASIPVGFEHLFSIPADGGPSRALTSGDWTVYEASVTEDGTQVVYSGNKNGDLDIWIVPVAGGEPRLLSAAPGFDGNPSISPDGKQVVFASVRSGNLDIWSVPVAGGTPTRLTDWKSSESSPRFTPDGKSISFLSNRDASGADVWIMPATGGVPKRVTTIGKVGGDYRWSPDGQWLAYTAVTEKAVGFAVFVMPAAGGEAKQISTAGAFAPNWSPDSREIGFAQGNGGYAKVEIHSVDGKLLRTLTDRADKWEYSAIWSKSGSQLLIPTQDLQGSGDFRVDLRPVSGSSSKPMTVSAGFNLGAIGFADGDKAAIVRGGPYGNQLVRINVPAEKK